MLNGKELGKAIANAIKLKKASGAISREVEVARHFGVKQPSIADWKKRGTISKEKLPELWRYFSDVVGPEHWGLSKNIVDAPHVVGNVPALDSCQRENKAFAAYANAEAGTRALVDVILKIARPGPWLDDSAHAFLGLIHKKANDWFAAREKKET